LGYALNPQSTPTNSTPPFSSTVTTSNSRMAASFTRKSPGSQQTVAPEGGNCGGIVKILFGAAAVIMFLLGVAWLVFPQGALQSWGLRPDDGLAFVARRYGALCLGDSLILWLARTTERSSARTGILLGNAVANGSMALLSLTA